MNISYRIEVYKNIHWVYKIVLYWFVGRGMFFYLVVGWVLWDG